MDHFLHDESGICHTIISMANIYEYGGFIFEFHNYCGPLKLKKDWEPAAKQGMKFFKVIDEWVKLPKEEKEATRLQG